MSIVALTLSLIIPPERPHFYQFQRIDHWIIGLANRPLYQHTLFDYLILVPYLSILVILAMYGIHRYHLVFLYLKHKNKVAKPKSFRMDFTDELGPGKTPRVLRGKVIQIASSEAIPVNADGQIAGRLPVTVRCCEAVLRVFA